MPVLGRTVEIAWIKRSAFEEMFYETMRCRAYETGGCLLGYWATASKEIVITNVIGPGPNAKHSKRRFKPDHEWQFSRIATIYGDSGRMLTYLGDWHSHPRSPNTGLGWRDWLTLRKIASYPPARTPVPVMALVAGGRSPSLRIWYLKRSGLKGFPVYRKKELGQIIFYT